MIVRKERPHPGAALSMLDTLEGFRHTAFICAGTAGGHRVTHLRLDRTWTWAKQLALAFSRLRAAFA